MTKRDGPLGFNLVKLPRVIRAAGLAILALVSGDDGSARSHQSFLRLHLGMTRAALRTGFGPRFHVDKDGDVAIDPYHQSGVRYYAQLKFDRADRVSEIDLITEGRRTCNRLGNRLYARLGKPIDMSMTGDNSFYLWHRHRSYIRYRDLWSRPYDPPPAFYSCWVTTSDNLPK